MNFIPEQPHHSLSEGLCYTLSQGCRIKCSKKRNYRGCKVGFAFFEDLSGRKSTFLEEKWVMKLF